MDPLTHALSGALLARATAEKTHQLPLQSKSNSYSSTTALPLKLRITAGFCAAFWPDLDFALRLIDTMTYLNWHQGPTHSLVLLPFWAWVVSVLLSGIYRRYSWRMFFVPACIGLAIHIAGDLITAYGLMLFAPFSTERYSLPLVFVIDPWFSLIIVAGLIASWLYPSQRLAAIAALIGLTIYVTFLSTLYHKAQTVANDYIATHHLSPNSVDVLPQPLSPYHWKLIIQQHDRYHTALVHLDKKEPASQRTKEGFFSRIASAYQPVSAENWQQHHRFGNDPELENTARAAWLQPAFEPFRTFSVFPVLTGVDNADESLCYWFYDLRFEFPELPPSFQYGICWQQQLSRWILQRHHGAFYID